MTIKLEPAMQFCESPTLANLPGQMAEAIAKSIAMDGLTHTHQCATESELATAFNTSRAVAREAVKLLANKGVVHSRQRKGVCALPKESWHWLDEDVVRWSLEGPDATLTYKELLELRSSIEPEAAAMVATQPDHTFELAALRGILKALETATQTELHPEAILAEFHSTIIYASGNRFFQSYAKMIQQPSIYNMLPSQPRQRAQRLDNAREIYSAIATRNADLARTSVRKYLAEELKRVALKVN